MTNRSTLRRKETRAIACLTGENLINWGSGIIRVPMIVTVMGVTVVVGVVAVVVMAMLNMVAV